MSSRDRKLELLRLLSQEAEPVTLSALIGKLEYNPSDRTVRRWIQELTEEGLVRKSGHTKDAKYIAVKPSGELAGSISSCFTSKSLKAIEQVQKPLYERKPVDYNDLWFDSYVPNSHFYLSEKIREELTNAGRHANKHDPAGTYAHQIFNRLLIDLSYNSSRLEGCTYSLLDTERLLLRGDTPEGKLDEETVMILDFLHNQSDYYF